MKKRIAYLAACLLFWGTAAAAVPDNIYFRAMQDEMARTKKYLRVKDGPKPFYIAYKLIKEQKQELQASFGALYPYDEAESSLTGLVYMYSGDARHNTAAFESPSFYYRPAGASRVADSYEGIRRLFWERSDSFYVRENAVHAQKMAYLRQNKVTDKEPDFTQSPRVAYAEELSSRPEEDFTAYQPLLQEISSLANHLPYVEHFLARLYKESAAVYFLDSEGNSAQYQLVSAYSLVLYAQLHTKDSYKETVSKRIYFPTDSAPSKQSMQEAAQQFVSQLQERYRAVKAEAYLGPVLLLPAASGQFFNELFVKNIRYSKPVLSLTHKTDPSAGSFREKLGTRVMSSLFDVTDRPDLRVYNNTPLYGFMPVDDEGVQSRPLTLVQNGKLKELPTIRAAVPGQKNSNGHARMTRWTLPRANVSNVFFTPKHPLTQQQLEDKLLAVCREQELEYCYILPQFRNGEINYALRIYTADGRKEPVYGLRAEGVTARALRDITAAGDEQEVSSFTDENSRVNFSVIAPAVLVSEMEFTPTQRKPDSKPFVPMPK